MRLDTLIQLVTTVALIAGGTFVVADWKAEFREFRGVVDTKFEYVSREIAELKQYFEPRKLPANDR